MKVFYGLESSDIATPVILTMGVFDGLHLGHQAIMSKINQRSMTTNFTSTVITFDPHPRAVLFPETAPPLLQTLSQRIEGLGILGIKQVVVLPFSHDIAQMNAEVFLSKIICEKFQAREVYLGKGFAFGRNRTGNIETLQKMSSLFGFFAEEVKEVKLRNRRISSTLIRRLIRAGRTNFARRMLGRPYGVEGIVIEGRKLGRKLSFPTANLHITNRVIPANGVYVTASLLNGVWKRSVTNIGIRPTVGLDGDQVIETHVLNFEDDLYGKQLRIRFLHRLRDEKKFPNLTDLQKQISLDLKQSIKYFEHNLVKKSLAVV